MVCNSKHFKQLVCILTDIGKYNLSSGCRGGVDHAEQYRDSDTIDDFRFLKTDDERFTPSVNLAAAFAFDFLTGYLV